MKRREFLSMAAAAGASLSIPRVFAAPQSSGGISSQLDARATARERRGKLLILIELKGGNDGLNTVIPFADSTYHALRKHIAIPRDQVLALDGQTGLHPALLALLPLWRDGQLAVVQGVGSAQENPSHFRSREIWETASRADAWRRDGWLTRAIGQCASMHRSVVTASFGSVEAGPFACPATLAGSGAWWSRVDDPDDVRSVPDVGRNDVEKVAGLSSSGPDGATQALHTGGWSLRASVDAALRTVVDEAHPHAHGAIRLTLDGFDTHSHQSARHAALLQQLANACATLREALSRRDRWRDTLVMTYSDFGRSVPENGERGTGHGGAAAHFVMGGDVLGGVYGRTPDLTRLDGSGSLPVDIDFRRLYATALDSFWKLDAGAVLEEELEPLPLLRT